MAKLDIITGRTPGALKVVIYGPEGIGKSTLAAQFPRPLFIDTEGSTRHMDVARTRKPASWAMLLEQVKCVRDDPSVCGTLVIDTADWAERLCIESICASKQIGGIEDMGYGKGYVYLAEEFGRLLNLLEDVAARGVHVVLTAHAMMRKFEQPDEMGAYDRWELKLQKKTAPLVKEWSDLLLFANYKTISVAADEKGKKFKAQGGRRVMYTTHHPCWDAKNRLGLPDELPLEYAPLAAHLEIADKPAVPEPVHTPPPPETPAPPTAPAGTSASPPPSEPDSTPDVVQDDDMAVPEILEPLLKIANVTEKEVREVIAKRQQVFPMGTTWKVMKGCGFVEGWVLPCWDKIVAMIRENPNHLTI